MSMPANQPVIRRGSHSTKLARFGLPIPPRIATFFDGPELQEYDKRRAFGLRGWSSDTKLKVSFGSKRLAMFHEYATDGHFGDDAAKFLPIAAVGEETRMFAVDTASPTLAVHLFDYEEGWSRFDDSFDAFLGKLLKKGEKTPSEHLSDAYDRAKELDEQKRYPEVIALLEPIVAQFPDDPGQMDAFDDARGQLGAAYNLMGISHEKAEDIARARACYERGLALGCDSAGLNIIDLYFNREKNYEQMIAYAEERREHTYAWSDEYAWFHIRNYLGQAYLLTNRPSSAVRAYHQISDKCTPERIDEAVSDLRELLEERPDADRATAESILAWLPRRPVAPPSAERIAELRAWWTGMPDAVKAAVGGEIGLDEGVEPTVDQLVRATQIDDLGVTHTELHDFSWLNMFTALDDLNLEGTGLVDLAPIVRHTTLTRLDISENQVASLRPLAPLTRLVRLSAGENPLESLDGVEALRSLTNVNVIKCKLTSVEPLRGLPELLEATVYENRIADLSPLADCPRLKTVSAFGNPLERGILPLAKLPWLETLTCGGEGPRDEIAAARAANPLLRVERWGDDDDDATPDPEVPARRAWWDALPQVWRDRLRKKLDRDERDQPEPSDEALRELLHEDNMSVDDEPLPDLEPLRRFVRADHLCVAKAGITDLAPIATLPRLRDLIARDNPLASLAPLSAARVLEELYIQRCGIASLAGLEGCTALRELWAEDNRIADLSPLANLADLMDLDLEGNAVASVTALAGKRRLHTIRLGQNRVTDVSPLVSCVALRSLEIWANPGVRGAVALAALPELKKIVSHGSLPPREIDELRKRRPDLAVD